ncbi:MAG TPA: aspartate aminotransferase family protein [Polyangiaceae bacterium]|jgi:4-aminobutyrate aminotransferase-like enzyme
MMDAPQPTNPPRKRLPLIENLPGPRSRALTARESAHLAPGAQAIASYAGVVLESGSGSTVIDVDGNRFLDLSASICVASIGYGHPRYISELSAQLARIHVGSFTTAARVEALESVTALTPPGLQRVQLFSGGAEAVESAIRLARAFTGKFEILSFWGGFHGKTSGALAQMGSDFKHGLGPLSTGAYLAPYADCAKCPFKLEYPSCSLACVDFAREKLKRETTGRLAAILVEPMQGTAGNVIPPAPWLSAIADLAKENGALLIADEMITGFGRTGRNFGVERSGVVPDIMTLGKALGGGYPVSAVATRDDISRAEPWSKPSFSSSSYGGNPLASAAIRASVRIIVEEQLVEKAKRRGELLRAGIAKLAERHPALRNVRGEGLFIGFDLCEPDASTPWTSAKCRKLFDALLHRGIISMAYAPRVRINPPLVITETEIEDALGALDESLTEVGP